MKRFVCHMLTLMVTVFGGIVTVNYIVDPGHVYHGQAYVDKVIAGISEGYHVQGISDIDERLYKLRFAELHQGESFDYLALGSSRIMTVSEDIMHDKAFLNLSISSCQIEEIIAFYQICKDLNIHYSNVLISADPSLFNGHYIDDRWKRLGDYVNEFMEEDENRSVLISSHISSDLELLCDEMYMIDKGKIILHEEADRLFTDYAILKLTKEDFASLDKKYLLRLREEPYGYCALTDQQAFYRENYPGMVMEKAGLDEVIRMMVKGDRL